MLSRFVERIRNQWAEYPAGDWILVALAMVAYSFLRVSIHHGGLIEKLSPDSRSNLYMTAASVSALVGGFGTAAISQYATASGRRMVEIRRRFGISMRKNWSSILKAMLIVSGGSLLALMLDVGSKPGWIGLFIESLLMFGGFRSIRLVWLFNLLIDVSDQDATEPRLSPPVQIPGP
ncbi:hypothetical protein [Streptomyces sp. TLI_171]|uniref:hypothetical protein n=1 Tax=Streptomyces sp. TLI_171 TaxID=1938859 RepID=UPI00117F1F04|nr:hypothetical protein [Streptomyces sp. TLI_171]